MSLKAVYQRDKEVWTMCETARKTGAVCAKHSTGARPPQAVVQNRVWHIFITDSRAGCLRVRSRALMEINTIIGYVVLIAICEHPVMRKNADLGYAGSDVRTQWKDSS